MIIEEFQSGLRDLEDITTKPTDDVLGRQQIIALNARLAVQRGFLDGR